MYEILYNAHRYSFCLICTSNGRVDRVRVLLTGMTPRQIGRGARLGYGVIGDYLKVALEHTGVAVDFRETIPGEDLRGYDVMLVGLAPIKSTPSKFTYGGLWAISQARAAGARLVFYVDDWQVHHVRNHSRSHANNPVTLFSDFKKNSWYRFDEALPHRTVLEAAGSALGERTWPLTLYPSWRWGDAARIAPFLPASRIEGFDPTPWAVRDRGPVTLTTDEDRERRWILAALGDQSGWLDKVRPAWPVAYFGPKGNAGKIPESQVREHYTRAWGVMSPSYRHAGSGWWRCRLVQSAQAGAVLLGSEEELGAMGPEWTLTADKIESMSVTQLRELAETQRYSVRDWMTPADQSAEGLRQLLQS